MHGGSVDCTSIPFSLPMMIQILSIVHMIRRRHQEFNSMSFPGGPAPQTPRGSLRSARGVPRRAAERSEPGGGWMTIQTLSIVHMVPNQKTSSGIQRYCQDFVNLQLSKLSFPGGQPPRHRMARFARAVVCFEDLCMNIFFCLAVERSEPRGVGGSPPRKVHFQLSYVYEVAPYYFPMTLFFVLHPTIGRHGLSNLCTGFAFV